MFINNIKVIFDFLFLYKRLNITFLMNMKDTCGNCKFFDKNKKFVNNSYLCNFHGLTTKTEYMGCYLIQKI